MKSNTPAISDVIDCYWIHVISGNREMRDLLLLRLPMRREPMITKHLTVDFIALISLPEGIYLNFTSKTLFITEN